MLQSVSNQCIQQGMKAKFIGTASHTASAAKSADIQGMVGIDPAFPFLDASNPATQAYQSALRKYHPETIAENTRWGATAWAIGKLFEKVVGSIKGGITPVSIKEEFYSLHDETSDGLTVPLNYVKDKPTQSNCYFTYGITDSSWVTFNGLKPLCAPSDVVATALAHK